MARSLTLAPMASRTPPTDAEYAEYRTRYRNWGKWGDDDEFGTLNHVTPDGRRAAAALVTEGRAVSMARPLDTHASPANPYPAHTFVALEGSGGMLDYVGCFVHGFTQTHIDALVPTCAPPRATRSGTASRSATRACRRTTPAPSTSGATAS